MKIATIGEIHEEGLKLIPRNKFDIIKITDTSPEKLKKHLFDVDAIAIRTSNLSSNILETCKNLKIVSRHGVGYDNVDLLAAKNKKITISITANSLSSTVAEHVFSMMLCISKGIYVYDKSVKVGNFSERKNLPLPKELWNKNMLVI